MDAMNDTSADTVARIDLAAVYRLLAMHGWGDVIFNTPPCACRPIPAAS